MTVRAPSRRAVVGGADGPAETRYAWTLVSIIATAFLIRLVVRLAGGPESFLDDSYAFYRKIATTFVAGSGFCVAPGVGCSLRMPLYPLVLSPFVATGWLYPGAVILQAAAGAAIVWLAHGVASTVFTPRVAMWAAMGTALSPYAVVHDTALQDTVFVNLFTLLTLWAAVRARPTGGHAMRVLAGAAVSAAVLTSARVALFAPALLGWLLVRRGVPWRQRLSDVVWVALPVVLLVGGWAVRNWRVVGAPVLTTESGASLFYGNNAWTFSHFPSGSIDRSAQEAVAHLTAERRAAMAAVAGNPVAEDRLAGEWARAFVGEHPISVLAGAVRKLWVVISAEYSPARGWLTQTAYRLVFFGLHVAAVVGLWRARRRGAPHGATYGLLIAFGVTTAVFWAHTSHKSVIDPLLIVYAASLTSASARSRDAAVQPRAV